MLLKTPQFWYRPYGIFATILQPIAFLYVAVAAIKRSTTKSYRADIPVICVGNITAGGSGKTPSAIALLKLIQELGLFEKPYFLTRGYGGKVRSIRRITGHEPAQEVGDEPLLLSHYAQTIVSIDRVAGADFACAEGADCILMDDGFQNVSLKKDISLIVIDGSTGLGNGALLPAGPLREKPELAFARAHGVIIIGVDQHNISSIIPKALPVFRAHIKPISDTHDRDQNYIAFAGLAHPDKFKTTLLSHGYEVIDFLSYPDHYPYKETDINHLKDQAKLKNARLITTEKDFVRLSPELREDIDVLPIELVWEDKSLVSNFLEALK
ncbi:MAG: tetraacyldisaccharide 4'-kinase [Alphaproteobacteria bacterium]|nr:tetraacyldisaccharide 4'-kinase [Alphaproteobacteria bacterium]